MSIGFVVGIITDPSKLPVVAIPKQDLLDPEGFKLLSPGENYIATSSDVTFVWQDNNQPNAVYDLHIYSDAARTQKVVGTSGVFDTNNIGTGKSHTFTGDPSDGEKRYGLLWQWEDATYPPATKKEILFEYTAFKQPTVLTLLSPVQGSTANSANVEFRWTDTDRPNAVYDLHIYSDPARTQKVVGTDGTVFDTNSIGPATNYTFNNDPADGGERYGIIWQWPDQQYKLEERVELLFEYTAHTKTVAASGADYDLIKADVDDMLSRYESFGVFDSNPMIVSDGYYCFPTFKALALMYRTTGDTSYIDKHIHMSNHYIDSGSDIQGNGYLTWWGADNSNNYYNVDHHEWRTAAGIADGLVEMIRGGYEGTAGTKAKFANFLKTHVWEKWQPGHNNTDLQGRYKSNIGTKGCDFVGRWVHIAMALDKAQAAGLIPSSSAYINWINSTSSPIGLFFTNYIAERVSGSYYIDLWTDYSRQTNGTAKDKPYDTSHLGDLFGAILRLKQNGYDPAGKMSTLMGHYESHINNKWFPNATGWLEYADRGGANVHPYSNANGMALSAHISTNIRDRWVQHYKNDNLIFASQERRVCHLLAGILSALAGGTW